MRTELPRIAGSTSFKPGMRALAAGVTVVAPLLARSRVSFECHGAEAMDWATHRVAVGRVCGVHFNAVSARAPIDRDGRYTALK